jgi:hypothetical protein
VVDNEDDDDILIALKLSMISAFFTIPFYPVYTNPDVALGSRLNHEKWEIWLPYRAILSN